MCFSSPLEGRLKIAREPRTSMLLVFAAITTPRDRGTTMVPNLSRYDAPTMGSSVSMDTIVNLCKRRGIILPNSEIYGGLRSSWDYGPLGVELKNNVKRAWWRWMVQMRDDVVGLDSAILLSPRVWE